MSAGHDRDKQGHGIRTIMIGQGGEKGGTKPVHQSTNRDKQAGIAARHHSHLHTGEPRIDMISRPELQQGTIATLPGEPRTSMISRLELQQGTTATHRLESQGQA
jgi:ribosomal protein L2